MPPIRCDYFMILNPNQCISLTLDCRKYQLRKVMVNGDIPPRVKKDAHALILDFIRSRPPLKKVGSRSFAFAPSPQMNNNKKKPSSDGSSSPDANTNEEEEESKKL